jgi:hypothetical protein
MLDTLYCVEHKASIYAGESAFYIVLSARSGPNWAWILSGLSRTGSNLTSVLSGPSYDGSEWTFDLL